MLLAADSHVLACRRGYLFGIFTVSDTISITEAGTAYFCRSNGLHCKWACKGTIETIARKFKGNMLVGFADM